MAVVGVVVFEGLSPDTTYDAASMPVPRGWYRPIGTGLAGIALLGSIGLTAVRWPDRPQYAAFGVLLSGWRWYPLLIGPGQTHHPIGYLLVIMTPLATVAVIASTVGPTLTTVVEDRVAGGFGLGVALQTALFLSVVTGRLVLVPAVGPGTDPTVAILPTINRLVSWPTLELVWPDLPLVLAVSPGYAIELVTLSGLVGANGAVLAQQWRMDAATPTSGPTAGGVTLVGACTCGCCGPLVAKLAVIVAGPSIAVPLYWLLVDSASPVASAVYVGALLVLTASLVAGLSDQPLGRAVAPT